MRLQRSDTAHRLNYTTGLIRNQSFGGGDWKKREMYRSVAARWKFQRNTRFRSVERPGTIQPFNRSPVKKAQMSFYSIPLQPLAGKRLRGLQNISYTPPPSSSSTSSPLRYFNYTFCQFIFTLSRDVSSSPVNVGPGNGYLYRDYLHESRSDWRYRYR